MSHKISHIDVDELCHSRHPEITLQNRHSNLFRITTADDDVAVVMIGVKVLNVQRVHYSNFTEIFEASSAENRSSVI